MKGRAAFLCLTLLSSFIIASPISAATNNLVEAGVTFESKEEFVFTQVLDDNTILTVDSAGFLSVNSHSQGVLTPIWEFELNVSASYAKIDSGEKLLTLIHTSGFLTFSLEDKNVQLNTININDPWLLEIGDGSVIGGGSSINCHTVERGNLILEKVKIGKKCTIGAQSLVWPGCVIGDRSVLATKSVLKKRTIIGNKEVWKGNPAINVRSRDNN